LEIKKKIKKFANIQRPILIIGETGVGKEVVARAVHEESIHHEKPFLAINCGALTDTLLQSELFGYEAGAFTGAVTARKGIFEAAEEGVVFLDEFGEMSHKLQVSLLRVFENNELLRVGGTKVRQIKCRIIAATNANIEDMIEKKMFRDDLYHRLKQFSILIPPLRERKEDISLLIDYFLNRSNSKQQQVFSKELVYKFQEYHWPGNIRELKNEIDRIKILSGYKPILEIEDVDTEWLKSNKMLAEKKEFSASLPKQQTSNDDLMHQRIKQKKLTLADKRNLKLIHLFQQYKQLTRGQIAEALEINLLTATKDLQRLCKEGVIVKKTPTLSPRSHFFELI
jgi:transcriptional regulator with PAS, ATPase and Fis domain